MKKLLLMLLTLTTVLGLLLGTVGCTFLPINLFRIDRHHIFIL